MSLVIGLGDRPAFAEQGSRIPATSVGQACPTTLATLIDRMLPDLPSYINRVRISAGISKSYILLAAKPEFEPLALSTLSALPAETPANGVQQVFFTTLMRRYDGGQINNLQEYHWVFLAQQSKKWQFVMMYSTIGAYPASAEQPPLAPRNSSDGSVAQAIKTWLRDCQTGNLQAPTKPLGRLRLRQR
jgi:hypothetical protein